MANYYATSRSNYFKVKDVDKFIEWCKSINVEYIYKNIQDGDKVVETLAGFIVNDFDCGGLPSLRYNEQTQDWDDIDILQELATHLQDNEVAVLMEVGAEKHRYVIGMAYAVNSKGETHQVTLYDIYELAEELGENITKCEY